MWYDDDDYYFSDQQEIKEGDHLFYTEETRNYLPLNKVFITTKKKYCKVIEVLKENRYLVRCEDGVEKVFDRNQLTWTKGSW